MKKGLIFCLLAILLVFSFIGCDLLSGPYSMEVYNISDSTLNTLHANSENPSFDPYNFVKSQLGTNRSNSYNGLTLEQVQQKLHDFYVPNSIINKAIIDLQDNRPHSMWGPYKSRNIFIYVK